MNKIYKSIWNHVTRTFTAVSEIQQTNGKKAKSAAAVVLVSTMAMGSIGAAEIEWGPDTGGNYIDLTESTSQGAVGDFVIGSSKPAYDYQNNTVNIGRNNQYYLQYNDNGTLQLEPKSSLLFTQSAGTSYKFIDIPAGISEWNTGLQGLDFHLVNKDGSPNSAFSQTIQQDGNTVAVATYAVGDESAKLFSQYRNVGLNGEFEDEDNDWRVPDNHPSYIHLNENGQEIQFSGDTGIHYQHNGGEGDGFWALAILTNLNLQQGQTLKLGAQAQSKWFTHLEGAGSVEYDGTGVLGASVEIRNVYDNLANDYAGETTAKNVSLELYRQNSFGQATAITASNSTININQSDAWTNAGTLDYNNVTTTFNHSDQTSFTVNNSSSNSEPAIFNGTNSIATDASSFTYLIEGDAEVQTGTTTFTGNGITTQIAGSLTLAVVDGISNSNAIQIGESLKFVNAVSSNPLTQKFTSYGSDYYTVNLSEGSDVKYANGQILSGVSATTLSGASKLETDTQANLGSLVTFNRQDDEARSQLTLTGDLTLATNLTGDGLTILDAGQDDGTNAQISLDSGVDLSNYSGWIRLQDGTMMLDSAAAGKLNTSENNIYTGLSLGSGSSLVVNDTTGAQTIENFGWSTASTGGVLDLTGFTFTDSDTAALKVNSIQWGYTNTIKLDLSDFTHDAEVQTGNIFALSSANPFQILVEGKEVTGFGSDTVTIEGIDQESESRILDHLGGDSNAAEVKWNIGAEHYNSTELTGELEGKAEGIYLNYSVTSLNLLNSAENSQNINPNSALLTDASLVAVASNDQSNSLTTQIGGHGILELRYAEGQLTEGTKGLVTLSNNFSTYTGATVVRNGVNLASTLGALGNSTLVLIESSDYRLLQGSDTLVTQRLNGIVTDSGSHTINVNGNTIEIVGHGLTADSASNMASGYGNNTGITAGNVLGANTKLSGGGIFSIGSDENQETGISLTAKSANAFNGYDGTVRLAGTGSSLTIVGDADLTDGTFATTNNAANAANAAITVDTNATIDEDNADFSGYKGTLNTTNHTYTVTSIGALGGASIVADGSTIILNGITNEGQAVAFNTAISKNGVDSQTDNPNRLIIQSSNIEINADSENKKGVDVVQIGELSAEQNDPNSILTLVSGTTDSLGGLADGGLGKFSSNENSLNVAFVGNGNLNLSGYELNSNQLKFSYENGTDTETFTGTLGLLGSTQYTLLSSAGYGVALNTGTLVVGGSEHLTTTALSFTGTENVLDLRNAVAASEGAAFFTVNGTIAASDVANDKLTVIISEAQRSKEVASKNILDQDDGAWDQWLVNAETIGNIASDNVEIRVGEIPLSDFTQNIASSGTATGYYKASGVVENGDIGASYKLTQIDFEAGALLDLDTTSANNNALAVVLTGTGTININGDITVNNSYTTESGLSQAAFTGKYAVESSSTLTLSGYGKANVNIDLQSGAGVVIASDQTATINANLSGGGKVEFAGGKNALTLTLTGNSTLQSGSALVSQNTNDRIVLSDGASLALGGANAALTGYTGTIALNANSTLRMSESGFDVINLNLVDSTASNATVDLSSGTYEITRASDYTGAWNVQRDSTLNLSSIGSKSLLAEFNNELNPQGASSQESGGVIALTNGSGIVVGSNAANFNGTWDLATSNSGEKLKVNGVLGAAEVTLGTDDELEYSYSGTDVQTISTAVNGGNSGGSASGIFKVSSGKYSIDVNTTVNVEKTDVISGASLKASLDQLGSTIFISGETSTVRVQDAVSGDNTSFDFGDKQVSGDGVLHIDLGEQGGNLVFDNNTGVDGNSIKVRLTNAAYSYESSDGFSSYVVGSNGRFVVGNQQANLNTIGWEQNSQAAGVIDLRNYDFTNTSSGPAIVAGSIVMSNNLNVVQVDSTDFTLAGTPSGGNILALDNVDQSRLLISGTWTSEDGTESPDITLWDENGEIVQANEYQDLSHLGGNQLAARVGWGVGATYLAGDTATEGNGIYLNYGITSIELLNNNDSGALLPSASLVAVVNASDTDKALDSTISGRGVLEFRSEGSGDTNVTVQLSDSENSYLGATVVRDHTTLQATGSALGNSTLVLVGDGAGFSALADDSQNRTVHGLVTDDKTHTITINHNFELEESTLSAVDVAAFNSGYGVAIDQNNTLGTNTTLSGAGTLTLNSDLTAKSALAFNSFDGKVAIGQDQTLTIESANDASDKEIKLNGGNFTGGTEATIALNTSAQIGDETEGVGADFKDFEGQLLMAAKTFDVYDLDKLGSSALVLNSSTVNFHKIDGEFANAVTGTGGTWNLDESNITLDSGSGTKEGFDRVDIGEGSTLTLVASDSGTDGGLGLFGKSAADNNKYVVAFSGDGTLNLSGYTTLQSNQIDGDNFKGIVGLQNTTNFTQIGRARYGVNLEDGTTLTASGAGVSIKGFNFAGNATLDLTTAINASTAKHLFESESYTAASDQSELTVKITEDQLANVSTNLNGISLLDQDQGGANWIVASGDASGLSNDDVLIQVNGETGLTDALEIELQTGVTGTYDLGKTTSTDGIAVNYKLTALDITDEAVDFELSTAGAQDPADLAVKLTGTGSIGIGGTIEVAYQEGSEFAGKYALDTSAHLILSGENSGVAEVDFGAESNTVADLTLNSDQKLILGTVGSGSVVTLKDTENKPIKLTVQGDSNVFADGSRLWGSTNSVLALDTSAQLEVKNVSTTLASFEGGIGLGSKSHLTLNGVAEGTSYSLDNISSNATDSTVTLGSGSYSLSGSTYTGEWELGNSATLNLGKGVSFTDNGAKLSSAADVENESKPNVNVGQGLTIEANADNLAGFETGTFELSNDSTLSIHAKANVEAEDVDAFLNYGVNVSGTGTLELSGTGTFNSDVTANTFRVASGGVTLGKEAVIDVSTTEVVTGATLEATKDQIGEDTLSIGGVLNVNASSGADFAQTISGSGTLHVDLGGTDSTLGFSGNNAESQTTIIVANGTHTYDANDGFTNYGVDANGTLKVSESNTDLASFTWQSSLVDNKVVGGTLDLSEIQYNGGPAMTVDNITVGDAGSIKLDLDSWVEGIENAPSTDTNLLDADNGNKESSVLVIKGEVTGDASNLVLDANQSGNTTTSYPNNAGESLATVHWDYVLSNNLNSESDNKGIALSYGVTELELANAGKADEVVLSPDESPEADDTFSALISGSGKLSIQGNVTLSHSGNTFSNSSITVTSGNKLTTQGSNVLGSGSNTIKLNNASYEMAASAENDAYSEIVTLNTDGNSSITLNGNRLNLATGSTISAETTFGGDAASNEDSALTALGEVTLEGASQTLGNLGDAGLKLDTGDEGNVIAKGDSISKLENISGNGKFTLALDESATATAGNLTSFEGTIVAGSGQTFVLTEGSETDDVKVDLSNGGTLTSSTESTIAGLTTTSDSVIDLGEMTVGGENASGMLTVADGNSTLAQGTELKVEVNTDITSESVLSLDDGKFTKLVTGLGKDQRADFTIAQAGDETITGKLTNAGGGQIGTAHYDFTKTVTADGDEMAAGLTSTLTKIDLTGELVLSNSADTSADLNAEVQGTNESAVTVSFGEIELVKNNSYGQLNVNEGATANLTGVQTITGTEGVVAGQIEANAGKLQLASDASLTFKNVQTGLADVSLNNNATLTLSGLDLTDNSSLLGATKLNVVDGTGSLQIVDSTGLLDDDNLVFPASPDYKATALDIAVQNSEVTLSDNWVDITDNLSMDVTGGSSVTMAGKTSDALSVDWSNLTVDQDSNVTLNGNGAALTFTGLNEGKLAGTVNINNVGFEFGANTAGNSVNNDLLESANVTFSNSDLVANGVSNVGNLTLDSDTTLAFQESKEIAMGEASSSLITVNDGKTLNLGGATIKIDTDDLSFDFKDTESGTTSAPLLNALNDAQQENVKYFQLVEGNVSGLGELTDMNGNALVDTSAVTVIGEDGKTVAELGFGANLQQGVGGKDLWVGQGLQKLSLFKSVELNAGDGKGLTLDGNGVFTINAVIEASDKEGADDVIDLTIAGGTPIRLAGANGNITGTTTVAEDGKLILANNNTLGSQTDLDVQGTLEIETGFTQSAKTLNVSGTGTLDLAEGAKLDVTTAPEGSASAIIGGTVTGSGTLAFAENAQVHIAETAKLNSVTWDLTKGAAMVIAAGTNGQSITSGTISGGTVVKNGTGDLTLGYGVVNNNGVAVDVQEGNLKIDDWTNTLTLKSLNLHKSEFTMFGNLATADGLSADGARITLGASDTDFKDYTIDGLYSGSATFVFDTALGETSDGDSLTFADGVAEGSHALVEVNNHTTLRPSMSVADLTLISVNGEVAEDFATLQGGNLSKDGFDWGLVAKEGENGYTDFYLSAEAGSDPSDPTDPSKPVYKMDARVGALAGFAASVDLFEMAIHDRQGTRAWINPITGEKTTTSLWMRQTMSKSDSSDSSGQFGGRSDDRATTIGGDILQLSPSGSGLVYAGLMAGFGSSDYDANSSVTGASAKADTDAWMVGAYAGWNQNDPKNDRTGAYLAGWVQYAHFSSDIVRSGEKKLEAKASGLSASLEAGWIVKAAEFQMQGGATEGAFYIEPHAQVTWWGTDYDNIDGENIEFEGQHNITTRLGARLTMETSGATNFSPYLEANWVHNTKEYGVQWGEAESYIEGTQNQAELKFGAETFFTDSFSGYAQIRANWGGDGYNRQEGSLGLKYRF